MTLKSISATELNNSHIISAEKSDLAYNGYTHPNYTRRGIKMLDDNKLEDFYREAKPKVEAYIGYRYSSQLAENAFADAYKLFLNHLKRNGFTLYKDLDSNWKVKNDDGNVIIPFPITYVKTIANNVVAFNARRDNRLPRYNLVDDNLINQIADTSPISNPEVVLEMDAEIEALEQMIELYLKVVFVV